MNMFQSLYFMLLVGGVAGLLAWALQGIVISLLPSGASPWLTVITATALLGGLIGGLTVRFDDKWSGNRIQARWIGAGFLIGLFAGALSGVFHLPIRRALASDNLLAVVLGWMLTGWFIGTAIGARWLLVNRARVAHGAIGGMCGGFLGGLIFGTMSNWIPDVSQALAFCLTGAGISFGIAFAPILLRDAAIRFVSSGDPRASSKVRKREWEIQEGDSYMVGSQSADLNKSRYGREVDIYLPDASVAPRHARIYGKDGRFFVIRHPDIMAPADLRRFLLRVQNRSVTSATELHDQNLIVLGRTTLMFVARRERKERVL
jgi:hypothetical protein